MHNQGWHLDLRKSTQVIRPKSLPTVFASLQLPERGARTGLPGKSNNFVESLLKCGLRSIEQRRAHVSSGQAWNPSQESPPEFVNEWHMQREIGHESSGNSSAQADAVNQHQPLDTLRRPERKPDRERATHGQADECDAFQAQSTQKFPDKLHALLDAPIMRHRIAVTKTWPVRGKYTVPSREHRNRFPKTKPSCVEPPAVQNHNRLTAISRSQTVNIYPPDIQP
jgi:hypothetical protein